MAYQYGVPSSTQNLIDTLISFAVASGGFTLGNTWSFTSTNTWESNSAGTGKNLTARALLRDSQAVVLAWPTTSPNQILLNTTSNAAPSTGHIAAQTDASTQNVPIELGTAPLRYWMFADGYGVNCVVEWTGGAYQHINIGYLNKYGSFTGGLYVTGSINNRQTSNGGNYYPITHAYMGRPFDGWPSASLLSSYAGHVRATIGATKYHSFGENQSNPGGVAGNLFFTGYMPGGGNSSYSWLLTDVNAYNARAPLIPVEVIAAATDTTGPATWYPLGRVNNACSIRIDNLSPADTILTDWMVFPWSAKNVSGSVASGIVNSANYGMAYKK